MSILFFFLSWYFCKQKTAKTQVRVNSDTAEKQTEKSPASEKCVADEPAEKTADIWKEKVSADKETLHDKNLNFNPEVSTNEVNINCGFTSEEAECDMASKP